MTKKNEAKKKRESKLLGELCLAHGYMFQKFRFRSDRFTMQFARNKKTGKSLLTPAVRVELVVPVDSDLGAQIVAMYKDDKKSNKGKK